MAGKEANVERGLADSAQVSEALKLTVYGADGRRQAEASVRGSHENKYVWKFGKMLQVSFDSGEFSHIHCKDSECNNEWKRKDGTNPAERFDIDLIDVSRWKVRCKKCGRRYETG